MGYRSLNFLLKQSFRHGNLLISVAFQFHNQPPFLSARPLPILTSPSHAPGERIAIIGAGATGTYTLEALTRAGVAREIVVFESSDVCGPGLAYSEQLNDAHALSNIAGIEIPPVIEPLNAWAVRQPRGRLDAWGIGDDAGNERAFFPRVVLGAWLADQFALAVERSPIPVSVYSGADVIDVVALPHGCRVDWRDGAGSIRQDAFDRVIVASGYGPIASEDSDAAELTGKAASRAAGIAASPHIGVLGSSLSGIDAVVAIAMNRGEFVERDGRLVYMPTTPWRATLFSRHGLLPEADFWFPHPLPELEHFTPQSAAASLRGEDGDLDRLFALFARALEAADPDWANGIGLAEATADDFAERYFAGRRASGPWAHARANLADVKVWHANHRTPSWRIAILKAHEVLAQAIPALSPTDLARLHKGLKRVFTDNYAAVPHLSIERMLALHDAQVVDLIALGKDYDIGPGPGLGWRVRSPNWTGRVDELIDARGSQAAALNHFPFPTLRLQLCASALAEGDDWKSGLNPGDDLTCGDQDSSLERVHLCALPFLLRNRPFVQGLVECAEMARAVSAAILSEQAVTGPATSTEDLLEILDKPSIALADGAVIPLAGSGDHQAHAA
ncbi:FAD/NAD(P)-binding protein [Rhizorhabdus sp. FW153]|uniref:FAD/NAD(P)-binding protein n=1 Tax=Rhizorhabdus sp. FW153 TaxID=3400216 RepID=UPI003CE9A40D